MNTLDAVLAINTDSLAAHSRRSYSHNSSQAVLQRPPSLQSARDLRRNESHATAITHAASEFSVAPSSINNKLVNTVLSDTDPLIRACKKGDTEAVRQILQQCTSEDELHRYVNARDKNGSTPIFHTVWNAYYSTLDLLLQNGANPNAQNNKANSALHLACEQAHYNVIQLLLSYSANPQLINYQHKYTYQTPSDPTVQLSVENYVKRFWLEVQRARHGQLVGNNHVDAKLSINRKPAAWKTEKYYQQRRTLVDRLDSGSKNAIHSQMLRSILHIDNQQGTRQSITLNKKLRFVIQHTTTILDTLLDKCDHLQRKQQIKPINAAARAVTSTEHELYQYEQQRAIYDMSRAKQTVEAEMEECKQNDEHKFVRTTVSTRAGKRAMMHSTLQRAALPADQQNCAASNSLQKAMMLVEQTATEVEKTVEQHKPNTPHTVHATVLRRPHTADTYQPRAPRHQPQRRHSVQYESVEHSNDELLTRTVLDAEYPVYERSSSVVLQQQIIRRLARQILSK